MSEGDIEKGARWSLDLARELEGAKVGIICLTPENLDSPWVHFEAGALSKTIDKTFVCPYLFQLEKADLKGPLAQFQATKADQKDTQQLVQTINKASGDRHLDTGQLLNIFNRWWPDLYKDLAKISTKPQEKRIARPDREILEEILDRVRKQDRIELSLLEFLKHGSEAPISARRQKAPHLAEEVLSHEWLKSARVEEKTKAKIKKNPKPRHPTSR